MTDTLFREEAIEARRQRLVGTVVAAVPPSSRVYTILLVAIAVVVLLFLAFGSYASSSNVRGIVAYDAGVARVFSPSAGEVREILVKVGDRVEAGTPLVTMSMAQGEHGLNSQLAEIDRQLAEIDSQVGIAAQAGDGGTAALREQQAGLQSTVSSLERQQTIARNQIALAESALARNGRLATQGAGSQRQVEDARRDLLSRRAESESLLERLATTRASLGSVMVQLSQNKLDAAKNRSQLLGQRAALAAQRDAMVRADHLVITAPVAGEVGDIAVEIGQRATAEQSLATVVPRGSRQEIWLYAPSSAIGFVKPGQKVRLRFDAFPYQKYGWGSGSVVAISQVAIDPANVDAAIRPTEPVFRVRVRLDSAGPAGIDHAGIRPGMTLSADLILQPRPLWALVLGPVTGSIPS